MGSSLADIVPEEILRARRNSGEDPERWWQILSAPGRINRIAVAGRKVLGYSSWVSLGDEGGWLTAELVALYVDAGHWRAGIGRRLFADAVEAQRWNGHERMVVWVLEKNERAQSFYEAVGCRLDGAKRSVPKLGDPSIAEVSYVLNL